MSIFSPSCLLLAHLCSLSPFFWICPAQFLWEQPVSESSKSERRRKQSQVCWSNMMGPEVRLKGEGQTLECVTKGWASLLMTPAGETSCSVCKGLHMYHYHVGLTPQKNKRFRTRTPRNTGVHTHWHSNILVSSLSHAHTKIILLPFFVFLPHHPL